MKKAQLISLTTYCSKSKCWSSEDIIIQQVQREDEWNHPYQKIQIPKMTYPKLKVSAGLLNFFKSEVNKVLP